MKNSMVQLVFSLLALMSGCVAEEFLPKILGVGFPVLFVLAQRAALRRPVAAALITALAAGALEDALSSLPLFTSVGFFLLVAALIRWGRLPWVTLLFTYPAYQLWLAVWIRDLPGSVFGRLLVAVPVGMATAAAVSSIVSWLERKAGVHERE